MTLPAAAIDIDYPRRIDFDNGYVLVHAPQITAWQDFKIVKGIAALEAYPSDGSEIVVGTATFRARTDADVDRRVVTVSELVVEGITLADGEQAAADKRRLLQAALPVAAREVPLDLVLSNLPDSVIAPNTEGIKADPPTIKTAYEPTLLLLTHGEPVAAPIKDSDLFFVVNTNWTLFTNEKKNRWHLLNGEEWLTAKTLDGKWSYPRSVPKALRNLPDDEQWRKAKAAAQNWKRPKSKKPPKIVASETPAEMIVIDGTPDIKPITEQLRYVANTTSHVFYQGQSFYFLVAGRWFSSRSLDGPWQHAGELPDAFREIPADHAKADVRASVPGTMEARMAALEALIPRRTEVDIDSEVIVEVTFTGEPEFEEIPGTSVARGVNTAYDVLLIDGTYYLCYSAAWYTSASPTGPWLVARTVPGVVYTIPPSSPSYHTSHVRVESSSNVHVSFMFTAGYYGSYVSYGVPVWGTGWYYPPYVYYDPFYTGYPYYPYYYSYPYTYGSASFYNPRTGLYGSTSRYYGPYGGYGYTSAYNPRTGTYLAAESMWDGDEWAGQGVAYNPRTGRSIETERYYDADDNKWKSSTTVEGRRGAAEINRRRNEDGSLTQIATSRGGSGERVTSRRDGGVDTRSEFRTADGRTVTSEGRFERGEGAATLRGSEGGRGTIERSVDRDGVRREGTFERDGSSLETATTRDGRGPRTTFETSDGARGAVSGRALNKTAVGQSASGDLYAGRNGNVYRRTDDGWQRRSSGSWESVNRTRSTPQRYGTSSLNRDYRARSHGMSQYRSRAGQFQSRGSFGSGLRGRR
jgi:hypothetical protein